MKEYKIRINKKLDENLYKMAKTLGLSFENNHIESCFYYLLGFYDREYEEKYKDMQRSICQSNSLKDNIKMKGGNKS